MGGKVQKMRKGTKIARRAKHIIIHGLIEEEDKSIIIELQRRNWGGEGAVAPPRWPGGGDAPPP